MFTSFERMMAWRYLRARKAEGFVSVIASFSFLGILLGVATLIIVMSVMNGFRAELIDRMLGINGHLSVYRTGTALDDYPDLAARIQNVPGVVTVTPMIESQALVTVGGSASGVAVRGLSANNFMQRPILANAIQEGNIENFRAGQIAIGTALADRLRIGVGDSLVLMSPKVRATPFGSMPRTQRFVVGMIFDVGMYEYNNGFVFMSLEQAQAFFQLPESVTAIEVMTRDPAAIDPVKTAMELALDGHAGVYDWRDSNSTFLGALEVESNVMFLILTLIILVAAFNIISSMIMLVKDKSRDIAIMRTIGATRRTLLKIFILTGASIGLAGTFVGAACGITFALNIESIRQAIQSLSGTTLFPAEIYFFSRLPAQVEWHEVVLIVLMSVILSILATLYPAWRAARLDPVEALRYE